MSAPYASTVMTSNDGGGTGSDRRPLLLASLGAACISASAILVKLADTGTATTAFFRCFLALPVLVALAAGEQRRHGPRRARVRGAAVLAGLFLAVHRVRLTHANAAAWAGDATVRGALPVLL